MPTEDSTKGRDAKSRHDLSRFRQPIEHYIKMYEQQLATLAGKTGPGYEPELSFKRRVNSTWGLISKGVAAIPYALELMKRREPEAREDGPAILAAIGRADGVVDSLLESLESESDSTAKDSLILALGRLKSRSAVPALAAIIRNESEDGDTRWTAMESLGTIVRKRFVKEQHPLQAAIEWLDRQPPNAG